MASLFWKGLLVFSSSFCSVLLLVELKQFAKLSDLSASQNLGEKKNYSRGKKPSQVCSASCKREELPLVVRELPSPRCYGIKVLLSPWKSSIMPVLHLLPLHGAEEWEGVTQKCKYQTAELPICLSSWECLPKGELGSMEGKKTPWTFSPQPPQWLCSYVSMLVASPTLGLLLRIFPCGYVPELSYDGRGGVPRGVAAAEQVGGGGWTSGSVFCKAESLK